MKTRTLSDTDIYHCAMDVDGEIITGQGTKLTIIGKKVIFRAMIVLNVHECYADTLIASPSACAFTDQNIMNPGTFILVSSNIISAVIIMIALVKWHFIGTCIFTCICYVLY